MGFSFRAVWSVIAKRWAYTCASFMCIIVVALLAASCGTCWYSISNSGYVQLRAFNATDAVPNYEYRVYHEVYEYFLSLDQKITLGSFDDTITCDYADGKCENLVNTYYNLLTRPPPAGLCDVPCNNSTQIPWDLTYYGHSYSAMFAFTLTAIIGVIILGILLQIICWTYDRWPGMVTLVLFIVAVVNVVLVLIFLLVNWTIFFGHQQFMRDSLDLTDGICAGGDSDDKEADANVLCTWNGNIHYSQYVLRYDEWYNITWRSMKPTWGPDTAWVLSTIAFGFVGWIFLLIVGWRPPFKL